MNQGSLIYKNGFGGR